MSLKHSIEKNGNTLFHYRGQIPVFIFIISLPFIYMTYYTDNYYIFSDIFGDKLSLFWLIISIISIAISFIGVAIRAYTIGTTPQGTSGRNTEKQVAKQLNTTGIYSMVRHPLYLGNYLMWAGLLIFTANVYLFIIVSLLYWIYYERIMFAEECYLEKIFGNEFIQWSLNVPAFIPQFKKIEKSDMPFSFKAVLRREYSGLFAITLCFTLVDYIRYIASIFFDNVAIEWIRISFICLIIVGISVIILRSLKHYTTFLSPKDNRD